MEERRVTGLDGKQYPGRYAPKEIRDYMWGRSHYLSHEDGLSVRQIVKALSDEGLKRSVGSVAAYLKEPCDHCSGVRFLPPKLSVQVAPNHSPEQAL